MVEVVARRSNKEGEARGKGQDYQARRLPTPAVARKVSLSPFQPRRRALLCLPS